MIKAPFNFVPLADQLFIPSWADKISQDFPFSDGISGYIDLTISAKSPMFIRNGHTKEEADNGKKALEDALNNNPEHPDFTEAKQIAFNSFSKCSSGYFIPSSSIKGEVRSILEILSFGKMRVDPNTKFAQREWDNPQLYSLKGQQTNLLCGYLRRSRSGDNYEIVDCGKPYRIGHDKIDQYLKSQGKGEHVFRDKFSQAYGINLNDEITDGNQKFDPKSAAYKYHLVGSCQMDKLLFQLDNSATEYSDRLYVSDEGSIKGDIVLTGQPDKWKYPRPTRLDSRAGKFYEFVFSQETGVAYPIEEIDLNHFKFIYGESKEWERVKNLLNTPKGVPVFYRKEKGHIKDFGLAFLYKLPYEKSPYDILKKKYGDTLEMADIAECIFGKAANNNSSFKGRVQFSNAFSDNAEEDDFAILVLNSPKASYYPIYIKQDGGRGTVQRYNTYNNGQLSGWKRYTIRRSSDTWAKKTGSSKLDTVLFPVKAGSVFKSKVKFHNLRPIELGALLSALTFHNTDKCFHQLGQGKPYGYGKSSFSIDFHCDAVQNPLYYMALFEEEMNKKFGNWLQSDSVTSLITMAQVEVNPLDYQYMTLEMDGNNEFSNAKQNREYLQDFRTLERVVLKPSSLLSHITTYKQEQKKKEEENLLRRKAEELTKLDNWCNTIIANIQKLDDGDLTIINDAIKELCQSSNLIDSEGKQPILNKFEVKKKQIEEAIRGRDVKETVAGGLARDISKVTSLGNLQGHIKTWLKKVKEVEGRDILTSDEIDTIRQKLRELPNKELKKGVKRESSIWREFAASMGEDVVNSIYCELYPLKKQ